MLVPRISGAVLAVLLFGLVSAASAQPLCEIDKAQQLLGEQPRPVAEIERLLSACRAVGSIDYRVDMFAGVMARDAGDTDRAIALLRKSHELAPDAANPALELAFTLEGGHPREAAKVYDKVLAQDPTSRAALLGLGRIFRGQYRLDAARTIYDDLLRRNPRDPDALNGLAWVALAERHRERARAGFEGVLQAYPQNQEAEIGLSKVDEVYRYAFDAYGTFVSTSMGSSWGFGGTGLIGVNATDTLEIGTIHYTNQLQTLTFAGVAVLPSEDIRVGYHRAVPFQYNLSLTYDFRAHSSPLPDEHWVEASAGFYITDYFRWFGNYRQAFGGPQWNGRLIRTGFGASLSRSWEVTISGFDAAQQIFNNYQNIFSWVVDIAYQGPSNTVVVFGVGYSPLLDNVDLHARATLPLTDRLGVQLSVVHNSINADMRAIVGLRFTW
jgi:tetratricopeptide (TPR) repeat protein